MVLPRSRLLALSDSRAAAVRVSDYPCDLNND